jgi:hypothetical protein
MAVRDLTLCGDPLLAARKRHLDKQFPQNPDLAADGFEIWWQRTFAEHTAVAAQASALIRAHRLGNSAGEFGAGQPH